MAARLTCGEFKKIAIKEFSCEIQEGFLTHLVRRHLTGRQERVPIRAAIHLSDDEEMHPRMIKKMCERLRIDLDEFKKYAPEAFLED